MFDLDDLGMVIVTVLMIVALVVPFGFVLESCICPAHAYDCQCNECVIDKCEAINHGDTCQCDRCLKCKKIGG